MVQVTVHDAQADLLQLVARACAGEEVILTHGGVAVARLVPVDTKAVGRVPGALRGLISADDLSFGPLPADELARWGG